MFTFDQFVDSVQTGKKLFVKTFVTNENAAAALNSFVDAQSAYTKQAFKAGMDTAGVLAAEAIKAAGSLNSFDYSKVFKK